MGNTINCNSWALKLRALSNLNIHFNRGTLLLKAVSNLNTSHKIKVVRNSLSTSQASLFNRICTKARIAYLCVKYQTARMKVKVSLILIGIPLGNKNRAPLKCSVAGGATL